MPELIGEATKKYNAVVIVTSDTCFEDPSQDESGPYVVEQLRNTGLFIQVNKFIVNDDMEGIIKCIEKSFASHDPALIITIGGTGMCPRDVTPEATSSLYEKHCSGIIAALHMASLRYLPHAALSRLTSGIIGATLVVNFPGNIRACKDCFACLSVILGHALEQVRYDFDAYSATHKRQQQKENVKKQHVIRSPSGNYVDLSPSSSSLSSIHKNNNSNNNCGRPTKNRPGPSHQRSRSASQQLRQRLTAKAIEESRDEDSGIRSNITPEPRQSRVPTVTKKFHTKRTNVSAQPPQVPRVQQPTPPPLQLPLVKILQNKSPYPQIPYDQSLRILESMSASLYNQSVEIGFTSLSKAISCIGSTLAEDIYPKRIVPPYSVSTMDGYVLNVHRAMKDAVNHVKKLPIMSIVPSLREFEQRQLDPTYEQKFFCYQINTGGRLPKFNYAVIPAEKAERIDDGHVRIEEVRQGQYVKRAGCDVGEQDVVKSGIIIGPVELSSIIAMGHKTIKILPRPKLGVLSTGDELEDFFSNEFVHQDSVADVNGPLLSSMFQMQGYFVLYGGMAKDDPNDIFNKITEALKKCDVLLITGGASMGTKDHVKDVISHMGGTIHFGRVDIKPGKPVAFASLSYDGSQKFIFSLPGNPVSAYITTLVLVNPFLKHGAERYLQLPRGITDLLGETIFAEIGSLLDVGRDPHRFEGRLEFVRAKIISKKKEFIQESPKSVYIVQVSVKQHSSRLLNLVECDCLLMVDPSMKGECLAEGDVYPAVKLDRKF